MGGWQDWTQLVVPFLGADLIESDLLSKLAPSQSYTPPCEHGYGGLIIATDAPAAAVITCTVIDATGIVQPWSQRKTVSTAGGVVAFTPPYAYTGASSLFITLTSSVNQVSSSSTFIFGCGSLPPAQQGAKPIRKDGREHPIGESFALGQSGNSSSTVIAAPGAGLRIHIHRVNWFAAAGLSVLSGTIGGSTNDLIISTTAVSYDANIPPQGLLLDANTALTMTSSGAGTQAAAAVTYDIVT